MRCFRQVFAVKLTFWLYSNRRQDGLKYPEKVSPTCNHHSQHRVLEANRLEVRDEVHITIFWQNATSRAGNSCKGANRINKAWQKQTNELKTNQPTNQQNQPTNQPTNQTKPTNRQTAQPTKYTILSWKVHSCSTCQETASSVYNLLVH